MILWHDLIVTIHGSMKHAPTAKIDARGQTEAEVRARRLEAARLHQDGLRVMEVVRRTGLNWATVNTVIKKLQAGGLPALERAARGRRKGQGRALSISQERELLEHIRRRRPWFYRLDDALWTQAAVSSLIRQKFDLTLSRRAVGNYLARWGIELKNPSHHPAMRCSPAVRSWMARSYSELQAMAVRDCAEIWWLNRPIKLDGCVWGSPIETTDSLARTVPTRRTFRLLSATNGRGNLRWIVITGNVTPDRQTKFIKGLSKDIKRNLILIRSDIKIYDSDNFRDQLRGLNRNVVIYPL